MSGMHLRNESVGNNENKISFLQLNLGHRLWAHEALMAWLQNERNKWILCIQEPYFSHRGITKLPSDYGAFWKECNNDEKNMKKPRAVIMAPRSLKGYMVTQFSNADCLTVRFGRLDIMVISCYCPVEKDIGVTMQTVLQEIEVNRKVICCMDANAYHTRWGSNLTKNLGWRGRKRGEQLIDILDENDLWICNQIPHLATFSRDSTHKDESHIDITICTYDVFNHVIEWKVTDETFMSDHRAIKFCYECVLNKEQTKDGRQEGGIPWQKPCKKMEVIMQNALQIAIKGGVKIDRISDVDKFIKQHTCKINQVLDKVFRKKGKQENQVFWWTDEVAKEYVKLRKARRRMRRYKYKNLKVEFVECRKVFREVVQQAKLKAWKKFTSDITDPWHKLIKIVKATSVGRILSRTLHDLNGDYAVNMEGTLVLLGRQFYPQPDEKLDMHAVIEQEVEQKLINIQKGPDITMCELTNAIKQMSSSTAPGFDTITNNVIKFLVMEGGMDSIYLRMFNICLHNYYFPAEWKKAKVVLIPKPSTELNSTKAFRPISLTSCFAKLFERIILSRMLHYLTLSGKISANQHAYQKGKSTLTALYELFDVVQYALHKRGGEKSVCVVVFLDISGAFDRTWHQGILSKLLEYNVPNYLVAWMRNFLSDRQAFFMDSDMTHQVNLAQGCPQGGVLSPVLWNVLFNEMLALSVDCGKKKNDVMKVIGYADDAAIVCKAASVGDASRLINKHLEKIYDWSKKYRIKFNPAKLAVLTISNRLIKPPPASVYYAGTLIKEVSEYKYLGLVVDSRCTWKSHMNNTLHKLSLVTRSLHGLSRSNWGISLQVYRMLFHAIFVPIMTYGIVIWGWKAIHKNVCEKFDKQIRKFALVASRCLKSTSSGYLFALLKTQSFAKILEFQVLKTSIQQFHIIDTKRKSVYDNYRRKRITKEVPQSIDHYYYMCRRKAGGLLEDIDNISFEDVNRQFLVHPSKWVRTDVVIENSETAIWKGANVLGWVVFSDASISTHGVGWGFTVFKNGFCMVRSSGALSKCSVFRAEAFALLQALTYVTMNVSRGRSENIEFCIDSQGLARALMHELHQDCMLASIKDELRQLHNLQKNAVIRWIPSHKDIFGNDMADKLAKKGTDNRFQVSMKVTDRDLKNFLRERDKKNRSDAWALFQSTKAKFFLPNIESVDRFLKASPSVPLCQIVSGHTRLNDFVCEKLGLICSSMCKCKQAKETISHYFFECELYEDLRKEIWPDFQSNYAYLIKDWGLVNEFVLKSKRFSHSIRDALLGKEHK